MATTLTGYELDQLLRRTRTATVYRARRIADGRAVVAKFYDPIDGALDAHYRHEFNLLRDLDVAGAVRALDLLRSGRSWVLILEAFPGEDLGQFAAGRQLELGLFFTIATRVSEILAEVHRRRVVHRDIKPSSVLFDPTTGEVCLADFGISIALEHGHRQIYDPGVLTGTLPYLSPEQTGRTARTVDHRSDLYSLGATFYELLVGRPPFVASDPMALVHAHLARIPTSVDVLRPELPATLARVIERLLAKDPVDRYQSAAGLHVDLERCAQAWTGEQAASFELGRADHSVRLELPDRLYGRGRELARINDAFDRVCRGGGELLLLRGSAGIGKTALTNVLQGPLAARGGYFAVGKFEQFRADLPFLGLGQAISGLIERLLIEDDASLSRWREALRQRLGGLAEELAVIAPALARLLGLASEGEAGVDERGAIEARNRIIVAVSRLLRVVAGPTRPVVLVLDDLQWSDPGSLRVLEQLIRDREGGGTDIAPGLLLIGAYRDAEVSAGHPFAALLAHVPPAAIIDVGPLSDRAVTELIADVLRVPNERAAELAQVIAGRTENNPLLIRQLLRLLEQQGVLVRGEQGWTWTTEAVRSVGISADALAVVEAKLDTLAPEQREALAAATCVGNRFDLPSLAAALERDSVELYGVLLPLVDEGLLALADEGFRFTHDRIEEAAKRALAPELEREIHGRIGRHRLANTPLRELELAASTPAGGAAVRAGGSALAIGKVYAIVDHLGWTVDVERDRDQLHALARLEELAGRAAIRASAYAKAEGYFDVGRRALARAGADDPGLALSLAINQARAVAFSGERERAERLFAAIMDGIDDPLVWARVALARVEVSAATGQTGVAIEWGLRALAKLGLDLDPNIQPAKLAELFAELRAVYTPEVRASLLRLPECQDELLVVRCELLARTVLSAMVGGGVLGPLLMITSGFELLRAGRTPFFAQLISMVGGAFAGVGGDFQIADELVEYALAECRRAGASAVEYVTNSAYAAVLHWSRHYRECRDGVAAAYEIAVIAGHLELAVHSLIHRDSFELALGEPLERLLAHARETVHGAASIGLDEIAAASRSCVRTVLTLMGASPEAHELESDADERRRIDAIETASLRALAAVYAVRAPVYLNQPERALELATIAAEVYRTPRVVQFVPQLVFHRALATAMLHHFADEREPSSWAALVESRAKIARWSEVYAGNYGHKLVLLDAELARIEGREHDSDRLYEAAATEAAHYGFANIEALCWERLARARIERDRAWPLTEAALSRAASLYSAWGADHKVALLEREFPALISSVSPRPTGPRETASRGTSRGADALDLDSVLKSTQGIAQGRDPTDVVHRVLAAAIENAGARRGVLVSIVGDAMIVELERDSEGPTRRIQGPTPLAEAGAIVPIALIRLVARTGAPRIVDDAATDPELVGDPLVRGGHLRSICCLPITAQGRVLAVLYLDNPLVAGVFTADRLAILEHLAGQAAITLESTRLMDALRDSEAQWRSLIDHAPVGIVIVDRRGRVEIINRLGVGARVTSVIGHPIDELFAPESVEDVTRAIAEVFATGSNAAFEAELLIDPDAPKPRRQACSVQVGPIWRGDNRPGATSEVHRVTLITTDISERRALETQLRHSQKLEAIGTLAGGVAHDFNNLLSVMIGSADLAIEGLIDAQPALREILEAAERAGALTRQLLAFSRKQVLQPRVLELDAHVMQMSKLLRRLLGERVELVTEFGAPGRLVRVDPGQLEQVVLNLVVNARDAMPRGGEIIVRTRAAPASADEPAQLVLSVCDTGEGMDEATRERIFEPFFTTKAVGQGTGLGLATVHGIVTQSGGRVEVESSPGEGARFHVYLPLDDERSEAEVERRTTTPRGSETVLLVEDEPAVRDIAATVLELQGYSVVRAGDADEALALAERSPSLDLLVTDVVLPGARNGRELAELLRERQPELPILFMSGYTNDPQIRDGVDDSGAAFLQKPFTREMLAGKVRALLDRRAQS